MKCPVCLCENDSEAIRCRKCGFSELAPTFLNIEEAQIWENTILIPYKLIFNNRKDYIATLKDQESIVSVMRYVCFFTYAEGGAMGSPGSVNLICLNNGIKNYRTNMYFDTIGTDFIDRCWSNLVETNDYTYFALGMGNHMLIKSEYNDDFKSFCQGLMRGHICSRIQLLATDFLLHKKEKEKLCQPTSPNKTS